MRPLLFVVLVALILLTIWLVSEAADVDDSMRVETVAWGEVKPWFVVEPPSTTVPARARTAPRERTTMRAASVAPTASAAEAIAVIREVFVRFGLDVAEQAVRIAGCETGGTYNPAVVNSSGHTGLFQLAPRYHTARAQRLGFTWDQMREARPNALVAADLYAEQGWRPWTCRYAA
jgi:hypothetical protein